ncbi:MAG TPA: hypothetical protein VFV33_09860 [Gemmatimonadaceae bacterium]|nr:hypothetical protein [Gemmatimonadaceae bacterium]
MQHQIPEDFPVGTDEFLSVRIAGGSGKAERFLLIGRPYEGLVRVREWSTHTFNTEGDDFEIEPATLLEDLETAYAAGLGLQPEIYQVRLWLS